MDAGTGAITQDATDDKDDVTADSLTADAATGIDLDTTVLSADLSVSGTGSIVLDELNAITLSDLDTTDGSITVDAAGDVVSTDVDASDAIAITASSGDITLGGLTAGGVLGITASTGSINDASDDAITDLTAGGLITLTAQDEVCLLYTSDAADE